MDYITLLNDFIEKRGIAKNTLIIRTGIDRSTFFQILNHKRIATIEQFNKIISQLNLTATEHSEIIEAFDKERLGDSVWFGQGVVRKTI